MIKKGLTMRRLLMASAALLIAATANADTYPYFSFMSTDGNVVSVGVESLEMTFSEAGDMLTVSNGEESHTMSVADLEKMYFSSTKTTGINDVVAASGPLQLYTVSGTYMGKFGSKSDIENNVDAGVYIVKTNGKTTKIAVR